MVKFIKDFYIKEYITKGLGINISKIEQESRTFTEFFKMFFDPQSFGFTNLTGILSAFYRKVDIKIQLDQLLFIFLNTFIENENMLITEIYRVYCRHEDYPGKGLSLQSLTTILNTINQGSINTFRALAEAKLKNELGFFNNDELELIIRRYNILENSEYLDKIYNHFYNLSNKSTEAEKMVSFKIYIKNKNDPLISSSNSSLSEDPDIQLDSRLPHSADDAF